jgi:hypothetical protein
MFVSPCIRIAHIRYNIDFSRPYKVFSESHRFPDGNFRFVSIYQQGPSQFLNQIPMDTSRHHFQEVHLWKKLAV